MQFKHITSSEGHTYALDMDNELFLIDQATAIPVNPQSLVDLIDNLPEGERNKLLRQFTEPKVHTLDEIAQLAIKQIKAGESVTTMDIEIRDALARRGYGYSEITDSEWPEHREWCFGNYSPNLFQDDE